MHAPKLELQLIPSATALAKSDLDDHLTQMQKSTRHGRVPSWIEMLRETLDEEENAQLREWLGLAYMGACVGFDERDLSPFAGAHIYIFERMKTEIAEVHGRIKDQGVEYNDDLVKFQLYDFGIQNVYHLDWDLYMSKELY